MSLSMTMNCIKNGTVASFSKFDVGGLSVRTDQANILPADGSVAHMVVSAQCPGGDQRDRILKTRTWRIQLSYRCSQTLCRRAWCACCRVSRIANRRLGIREVPYSPREGVLQFRRFLATNLTYPRRNSRYHLSQMILALVYPIVLGLDRLETASFLRSNGTSQFLTGLPGFPIFRLCVASCTTHLRFSGNRYTASMTDCCRLSSLPAQRSRLIFDLDSTVVIVFGNQQDAAIGYNPRYRGKKSYDPLLCMEANSFFLWDAELRPGKAGTCDGILEVRDISFANIPPKSNPSSISGTVYLRDRRIRHSRSESGSGK